MKLVANRINQTHLRDILPTLSGDLEVDAVMAAIAYGNCGGDEARDLVGHSVANKLRLDLWMRYDHTVPVAIPLLRRLLKHQKDNVFTQFVPDCFHTKIIWWKGYGAYIGSANHTDRGWLTNLEAGIFLEEDELVANNMDTELANYFDYLKELDKTIPISADYIAEMERLQALNKNAYAEAKKARSHAVWESPSFMNKKSSFDKRKETFKTEWLNTLGIMQNIEQQLSDFRPKWIEDDIPSAWQVDQFLHAYYYNRVGDKLRKPYEDYYAQNKSNPQAALIEQMKWWKNLSEAPSEEDKCLYEHAPRIRQLLKQDKIMSLTIKELEILFRKTHATMNHVIKVPLAVLGKPNVETMDKEGRVILFAELIAKERNRKGWDIRQLLNYVLYGGDDTNMWERIYHAGRDSEYSISRYGLNSIAEVAGWAKPEVAPPRNGRTSKALKALGYDVKVY